MWSVFVSCTAEDQDARIAEFWEAGTAGIIELPGGVRAFFSDKEIARKYGASELREELETFTAGAFEEQEWEPLLAGARFFIAPPWVKTPTPLGRIRLTIDASMAFGSGRHESTQLSLEALEMELKPGVTVIDVGCGSGILMAAAAHLGAGQVIGCDIHADAIETARSHVSAPLFIGSADAIRTETADLVMANISAAVMDRLAADIKRVMKPGARVILAGFIQDRVPEHYFPERTLGRGEWLCWVCKREDIRPGMRQGDVNLHPQQWWTSQMG